MLKERVSELEARLLLEIRSFYGERLISIVVFGSVARETQSFDSDLDILTIAEGLPKGRMKRNINRKMLKRLWKVLTLSLP